jgi:hypothetical protein
MILSLLTLVLFPQNPTARELAWEFHQMRLRGPQIIQKWQNTPTDLQPLFLDAASRAFGEEDFQNLILHIGLNQELELDEALAPVVFRVKLNLGWLPKVGNELHLSWLRTELSEGWVPPTAWWLEALSALPPLRSLLLEAKAGVQLNPDELKRFNLLMEPEKVNPGQRALAAVIQLDSGHQPASIAEGLFDLWLSGTLSSRQNQISEAALRRHVFSLSPLKVADLYQTIALHQKTKLIEFALKSPAHLSRPLLLFVAFDSASPIELRSKACLVLLRGQGDTVGAELLPLIKEGTHPALLQSLLVGFRPWQDTPGLNQAITQIFGRLSRPLSALAMEILVSQPQFPNQIALLRGIHRYKPNERKKIAQSAWFQAPGPELLQLIWSWTDNIQTDWQTLARSCLRYALNEEDLAAGYAQRITEAKHLAHRMALLKSLRFLRSDASLIVYANWLESDEGRHHPQAAEMATILVEEEGAKALFESWTQQPNKITEEQLDVAAIGLIPFSASARTRVKDRWSDLEDGLKFPAILRFKACPQEDVFDFFVTIIQSDAESEPIRRMAAVELSKHLPQSKRAFQSVLVHLAGRLKMSGLPTGPWPQMVQGGIIHGEKDTRQIIKKLVQGIPPKMDSRRQLFFSLHKGLAASPVQVEASELLADLIPELQALPPVDAFSSPPSSAKELAKYFPLFAPRWAAYSALPAIPNDEIFATTLEASALQWNPNLLAQCLASLSQDWVQSKEFLKNLLGNTEAPNSPRRPMDKHSPSIDLLGVTEAEIYFKELERRFNLGDANQLNGLMRDALNAKLRWPSDRRGFLWCGWVALAREEMETARKSFGAAQRRSGYHPYTTLEPRLGLVLCQQIHSPSSPLLQDFLAAEAQADILLNARLPHLYQPQWRHLLPPPKEGN